MRIVEFRIRSPLNLNEFDIGFSYGSLFFFIVILPPSRFPSYVSAKAASENSGSGDGTELVLSEPFEKDGHVGRHTVQVYLFVSFNFLDLRDFMLPEELHNGYVLSFLQTR